MKKLVRSAGYERWKRMMGYVYVGFGAVMIGEVVTRAHAVNEMLPGILLGGAFAALGIVRLRGISR